jgi:hypothetical protein
MRKEKHTIPFTFTFDPAHKGAPYTLDGGSHWMNAGQFKQIARVAALFGRIDRPDHIPYDVASDIPELHESVKSSKATLVNMILGNNLEETLEFYLAHTVSRVHSWVCLVDEEIITYIMDIPEFKEFTKAFGWYDEDRKVVRYKAESTKMIKWFESRL